MSRLTWAHRPQGGLLGGRPNSKDSAAQIMSPSKTNAVNIQKSAENANPEERKLEAERGGSRALCDVHSQTLTEKSVTSSLNQNDSQTVLKWVKTVDKAD